MHNPLPTESQKTDTPFNQPVNPSRKAFCQWLIAQGRLSEAALMRADLVAAESHERFEAVLTRLGLISEQDLAKAFATFLSLPLTLADQFPDTAILPDKLNPGFLKSAQIIPLFEAEDGLHVATVHPLDAETIDAVRFASDGPVRLHVCQASDFDAAFERLYGGDRPGLNQLLARSESATSEEANDDIDRLKDIASEAPVIRLVNLLIARAVEARASDIHIEAMASELRIRYRIDGMLQAVPSPPHRLAAAVVSRVKIMAKLNIAERRLAQDGRISMAVRGRDIDLRVATTPTIHGESVTLRILDRAHLDLDFASLGFDDDVAKAFQATLRHPYGIVLVTGPTGSGKTTTLYTALLELNTVDRKILTIEDPVEYQLNGINQTQVKPQIDLTFASALRSFLRHDPDIMMVGEIRDTETAEIAVQAALTGHLILSTLHTNDAASAITRLLDMGIASYLITSTLNGIAAQRLVRKLCVACREAYAPAREVVERLNLQDGIDLKLYRPRGCPKCGQSGYHGRSSVVEVLPVSEQIRKAILRGADASTLQQIAIEEGMQSLYAHGVRKVLAGTTSVEELWRATRAT
jgi:general secretion pathway protein E